MSSHFLERYPITVYEKFLGDLEGGIDNLCNPLVVGRIGGAYFSHLWPSASDRMRAAILE